MGNSTSLRKNFTFLINFSLYSHNRNHITVGTARRAAPTESFH
jgi:hypothetical protein